MAYSEDYLHARIRDFSHRFYHDSIFIMGVSLARYQAVITSKCKYYYLGFDHRTKVVLSTTALIDVLYGNLYFAVSRKR